MKTTTSVGGEGGVADIGHYPWYLISPNKMSNQKLKYQYKIETRKQKKEANHIDIEVNGK